MANKIKAKFQPVYDAGSAYLTRRGIGNLPVTSGSPATAFAVTDAPEDGGRIGVLDFIVSSDKACTITFYQEGATSTTLLTIYLAAGETRQLTPRGDFVLKTPGKKLYAKASDNTATVEILPVWWSVPAKAN